VINELQSLEGTISNEFYCFFPDKNKRRLDLIICNIYTSLAITDIIHSYLLDKYRHVVLQGKLYNYLSMVLKTRKHYYMTGIREEPSLAASTAYEVGVMVSISIDLIFWLFFLLPSK
jgi:hypothetical protein